MNGQAQAHSRRTFLVGGILLVALFGLEAERISGSPPRVPVPELLESAVALPVGPIVVDHPEDQIRSNPLAFLRHARQSYDQKIRDYECRFSKQESLHGRIGETQVSEVKFREGPFSVFMTVVENPGRYRRVLYVKDEIVKEGQQYATIEPQGAIARFLVKSVQRPIDGEEARQSSRRLITQFGFANSLDLIVRYADLSAELGQLDLRYMGPGEIDGRPTYVFERRLPIQEPGVDWPDTLLVFHIDQEWHLPLSCCSYADLEGRALLGRYTFSNVRLNVGLDARDFDKQTYGM